MIRFAAVAVFMLLASAASAQSDLPVPSVYLAPEYTAPEGLTTPEAELYPRLRGALRTDAEGRYQYETVRPGSYDGNAAHVHYIVTAPGYKPRLFDLWFQDDPILVERREAGEPQIPQGMRNNDYFLAGPDFIAIRPVVRDETGTWHAVRNVDMIPE